MTKDVVLQNEQQETIYPKTKASLLIKEDGSPFNPIGDPATADRLGGVKIGQGITVQPDGTINASMGDEVRFSNKPEAEATELRTISAGGVNWSIPQFSDRYVDLGVAEWDKQQIVIDPQIMSQLAGMEIWIKLNVPAGSSFKVYETYGIHMFNPRTNVVKDKAFVDIPDTSKVYGKATLLPQINIENNILRITSSEQNGEGTVPDNVLITYARGIRK